MKNIILLSKLAIVLLFFSFPAYSQKLDNTILAICNVPPGCQEEPICTLYDDCFRFDFYAPKDLGNGTSALKYKITNYSESTFKQATFELPGQGASTPAAVSPTSVFRNRYNHSVINKFNDSLIAFNAINAGTFSYGGFEVYYYIVNNADLNAPYGRKAQVTAKAGRPWQLQRTGTVNFDFDVCQGEQCPTVVNETCYKEDCCFGYQLNGTQIGAGPGQFRPDFTLTEICGQQVTSVSFSLPNLSPEQQAALDPFASTYAYTTSVTSTLLTFTATTADFDSVGEFDDFAYLLPESAVTAAGGNLVTVTITTTGGTYSQTFDLLNTDPNCGINPLPVELSKFAGKASPEGISLNWTTVSEKDNDRFEIERSVNGRNFERIATVKGNGSSSSAINYGYLDASAPKSMNYYRLKQVDFNGAHEYSRIITVNNEGGKAKSLAVMLVPNPCHGENCSVRLQATDTSAPITIELQDLAGRTIFSKQIPGDQSSFQLPRLDTGGGVYILSAKNGKYAAHQKVIIQ
ncbi:T9SS type A sorting domain-containing protein [Adhaeribacter sp. BT258]|uniref:T9SS type A sorting domain-containing protein n=1 Tax=Adhaeribacter terrigena TaxID=2793070 RepID=A0ABS1C6Z9_9BACT|nr:T9SS type A sorting domain-containing protein [Adhaeribacter terrigena]MBK0404463.1 T9SS type A sorting domain-containing protein [Adhaeribacter terrigena]